MKREFIKNGLFLVSLKDTANGRKKDDVVKVASINDSSGDIWYYYYNNGVRNRINTSSTDLSKEFRFATREDVHASKFELSEGHLYLEPEDSGLTMTDLKVGDYYVSLKSTGGRQKNDVLVIIEIVNSYTFRYKYYTTGGRLDIKKSDFSSPRYGTVGQNLRKATEREILNSRFADKYKADKLKKKKAMEKYTYKPIPSSGKIVYLQAISDPVWDSGHRKNIPDNFVTGSLTWALEENWESPGSLILEDNRHAANFDRRSFQFISRHDIDASKKEEVTSKLPPIESPVRYRFKTKEEFIKDGTWKEKPSLLEGGYPYGWNSEGKMNKYLGMKIPESLCPSLSKGVGTLHGPEGWSFRDTNLISIDVPKPSPIDDVISTQQVSIDETVSSKGFRFLTTEEFLVSGEEIHYNGKMPEYWGEGMEKYIGQPIPEKYWKSCESNSKLYMDGWTFLPSHYKRGGVSNVVHTMSNIEIPITRKTSGSNSVVVHPMSNINIY